MSRRPGPQPSRPSSVARAKNDMGVSPLTRQPCSRPGCDRHGSLAFVVDRRGLRPVQVCDGCLPDWRARLRNDGADLTRSRA